MRIPVVEVPVIVHVVKIVEVVEVRVIHVHMIPVSRAAVIPRTERLTPTEREPAIAAAPTESEAYSKAKSSAKESDIGRAIERRSVDRTRAPSPIGAEVVPTSVVVRGKTPWLRANPSPTPGRDVGPVAVAIRSTIGRGVVGDPDFADFRLLFPGSEVVEGAVAYGIAIDVARGGGLVFLGVAFLGPAIEGVRLGGGTRTVFHSLVTTANIAAFTRV